MAQLKSTNITGNLSVTGNVLASKIIKFNGTSDDILMGDGSTTSKQGLIDSLEAAMEGNSWRPIKYGTTTVNDTSTTLEFAAGSNIGLTFTNGKLTIANNYSYSLPLAANGTRGGIQVGYTASGANLPVQLSGEKAYVALTKAAVESVVTIPTIPGITITDTDKTNKIVGGITASGHTITVSRISLSDLGLASAYKFQGSKDKYENLPSSNNVKGDVWNVTDTGMNYAWTGTEWDALGSTVDLSSYVTGSGTANHIPKFTAAGAISNSVITQSNNNDITVAGKLIVQSNGSTSANSYNEGIRVLPASNGWSELFFSNNQNTSSTHAGGWILGKRGAAGTTSGAAGDFTIECNGSNGTGLTLYADNTKRPRWNNNELAYKSELGNASLPLRLQTYSTAETMPDIEADEATEQGWYYISRGDTNRPPFKNVVDIDTGTDYRIMSTAHSDNWVQQIATNFRSNDIFIRRKQSGTWQGWTSLVKMEEGLTNPTGTANAIPRWEGIKNSTLKNSGITIDDNNNLTAPGNITLYKASGDSPKLIFLRGTTNDSQNDWAVFDNGGSLHFENRGSDNTWTRNITLLQDGGITLLRNGQIKKTNTAGTTTYSYTLPDANGTLATQDWVTTQLGTGGSYDVSKVSVTAEDAKATRYLTFVNDHATKVQSLKVDDDMYYASDKNYNWSSLNIGKSTKNGILTLHRYSGTDDKYVNLQVKDAITGDNYTVYMPPASGTLATQKWVGDNYQNKDTDLTAIAGLGDDTTTGLLRKNGKNSWGLDSNIYLKPGDNASANYLAFFKDGNQVSGSKNTYCDGVGNIKAASYGIYTDVANNKVATWQYNSSTDCVELVW